MDLEHEIASIAKVHADLMKDGLKHGEIIAMGKVCSEINRMEDAAGVSTGYWIGYRRALMDVRRFIMASRKDNPEDWNGVA
jgi:hypothetical protein